MIDDAQNENKLQELPIQNWCLLCLILVLAVPF